MKNDVPLVVAAKMNNATSRATALELLDGLKQGETWVLVKHDTTGGVHLVTNEMDSSIARLVIGAIEELQRRLRENSK